jgi:signal transduction histidine kinase
MPPPTAPDPAPLQRAHALLIEDNPGDARLIREMLSDDQEGASTFELERVERLEQGMAYLAEHGADVVLLDLSLPDSQGLDTFLRLRERLPMVPVVVLSGLSDETVAVRAVHEGAQDYLVKGHADGHAITRAMRYAVERKRLEEARRQLERQRDEFFSSVSHDLRTPVAAIKTAVGVVLAAEPADAPARIHRMLVTIEQAADELSMLVDDLLQIARLQSGRVELWKAPIDLRDVVRRAARSIEPLVESRQQRLELALPGTPVVAEVDAEQIGRALRNLLANAQKYGREGGRIVAHLEGRAEDVVIEVSDDGPGIPPDEQERIFERFYRSSTVHAQRQLGTGLGLPIARALVELHGGRVSVESTLGQGSTFRITLPLDEADRARP